MRVLQTSLQVTDLPKGCGCSACVQAVDKGVGSLNTAPVNDGDVSAPSIAATKEQFADYLTNGFWGDFNSIGRQWNTDTDNNITFSLSNAYTATQQEGFRMAFENWSDVADITFTEVTNGGDIDVVVGNDGRAYSSSGVYMNGDIAYNTVSIDTGAWYWQNFDQLGDYALITAIHEIGHSLGLGHTGNYNGSATYDNDAVFTNDSRQYSVMSYFNASETGANHQGEYASTPMLMDIYAIQQIYGANYSIRSGDTTYGFNSNAGRDQYDFTINTVPVVAIWDGAGNDTIDVSGWSNAQLINLNDGTFSNVGGGTGNLSIAYGALIENVIGGSGADTIYGNDVANILTGNAGADTFYGSAGDDTIDGGDGNDTVSYALEYSDVTFSVIDSDTLGLTSQSGEFTDTISNVESYIFNGVTYTQSQIMDTLRVDPVQIMFGNLEDIYYRKIYNSMAGQSIYTLDDMGLDGSIPVMSVNHTQDSLTITNVLGEPDNNFIDYARVSDAHLTHVEISNLFSANVILKTSQDTNINIHRAVEGTIYTAGGNDEISLLMYDDADGTHTFDIFSGAGNDSITIENQGTSIARVYAGIGNDIVNNNTDGGSIAYGDMGEDLLIGGSSQDYLYGGADNDIVYGNGGADILYGDGGDDEIDGGDGNDFISGGDGDDDIDGQNDRDTIYGGSGADTINGGQGDDFIHGENDDDNLFGEGGNDIIYGGYGHDDIWGMIGDDRLYGQDGHDTIYGGDGGDKIYGGNDNDTLYGENGADVLAGENGIDTIYGGADNDIIYGGIGDDILHGDDGDDYIDGGADNDAINGNAGDDSIVGRDGDDVIYGGIGNDYIYGGNHNDYIHGGVGTDRLYGEAGDDVLIGNGERDSLYGGEGADMFALSDIAMTYDRFSDFDLGEGDTINITDVLTGYTHGTDDINDFVQFIDLGSYTNMMISENGDENFVRGAQIFGNSLDGLSVDDLISQNDLIVNSSVL